MVSRVCKKKGKVCRPITSKFSSSSPPFFLFQHIMCFKGLYFFARYLAVIVFSLEQNNLVLLLLVKEGFTPLPSSDCFNTWPTHIERHLFFLFFPTFFSELPPMKEERGGRRVFACLLWETGTDRASPQRRPPISQPNPTQSDPDPGVSCLVSSACTRAPDR